MAITKVHARTIYDSRGNPTVECEVHDENGTHVAQVPSGASTGALEAHELRDGDKSKWGGKGVTKAVNNVNSILGPELIKSGLRVTDQTAVDELLNKLDGTDNKSKLGANAILALSMAVCEAGAKSKGVPLYSHLADLAGTSHSSYVLPVPMLNIINGGSHAGGTFAFQECMICPDGASSFAEAMRMGSETYQVLKSLTKKRYGAIAGNVGDEGGFAPELKTADEALDLIMAAIKGAGYEGKISIAMDVAASEFYTAGEDKPYDLDFKADASVEHRKINYEELAEIYKELMKKYPIVSIEDGFAEDDFEAWSYFYKSAKGIQLVGDDLTVSNVKLVQKAQDAQACNGLLLKVNQIGSITEAIKAAKMSYGFDWGVMTSHRSGETSSTFIADLAVGIRCGQIKSGAPCRSERLGKYNRLLAIEEELGDKAVYAGKKFRTAVKI